MALVWTATAHTAIDWLKCSVVLIRAPHSLTKSICEILVLFSLNMIPWYSKRILLPSCTFFIVELFIVSLLVNSLLRAPPCGANNIEEKLNHHFFLVNICFRSFTYNHELRSNVPLQNVKISWPKARGEGRSTLWVSLTENFPFLDAFPYTLVCGKCD